jgi:hypothetical protein
MSGLKSMRKKATTLRQLLVQLDDTQPGHEPPLTKKPPWDGQTSNRGSATDTQSNSRLSSAKHAPFRSEELQRKSLVPDLGVLRDSNPQTDLAASVLSKLIFVRLVDVIRSWRQRSFDRLQLLPQAMSQVSGFAALARNCEVPESEVPLWELLAIRLSQYFYGRTTRNLMNQVLGN